MDLTERVRTKKDKEAGTLLPGQAEEFGVSLEKCLLEDLIEALQYLKRADKNAAEGLFPKACSDRMRDDGLKLEKRRFRLGVRNKLFSLRTVKLWNRLPGEVVEVPPLEISKARLQGLEQPDIV